MASSLQRVLTQMSRMLPLISQSSRQVIRTRVNAPSGAILPGPKVMKLGVPALVIFITPFVYIGATISKEAAAFLEENDIFVPDDDD